MKIICFAHVFWLCLCICLSAQTRYYCYDAAGNCLNKPATNTYSTTNGWGRGEAEEDALNSDVWQNNIISISKIIFK